MQSKSAFTIIVILLCLLLATFSCSSDGENDDADDDAPTSSDDDDDDDDDSQSEYTQCKSGVKIPFDLSGSSIIVPFPNDLFTVSDSTTRTRRRVLLPAQVTPIVDGILASDFTSNVKKSLNTLDGFSTSGKLYLSMPEKPDLSAGFDQAPSTNDAIYLIEIEAEKSSGTMASLTFEWIQSESYLTIEPLMPLKQAAQYALVVTDKLVTEQTGVCFGASDTFDRIRQNEASGSAEKDAHDLLLPLFEQLEGQDIAPESISTASVFTTQDLRSDLEFIHNEIASMDMPLLSIHDVALAQPDWDNVGLFLTGTLHAPVWRNNDDVMDHNAAGNPHRQGTEEIPIWITMPEETTHAQPLPIVVYQHGFNRSKETGMADISRWLCDAGFAVVAMDLPVHGDRCEAPCIPGIGYLNFFDLPEFRDNSRQAIADHLSLLRALNQLNDLDQWPNGGDGTPDLDTENVFFLGHSLGGMVGASTMTLSPVYQAGATHSSGAGFREIIFNMNQLEIVFSILKSIQERTGQPIHDRIIGLIDLAMWVLEPGDPRSFAPLLNAPQADGEGPVEILVQINAWDWFMPPPASYAFLRHANLSLMEPIAESVDSLETVPAPYMGSVGFQIPMDSHDTMFQLPSVPEADAAQQQIVEFFNTKLTTGSATAVDPW